MNIEAIRPLVEKHRAAILKAERDIWAHPETGYREVWTNAYMKKIFEDLGYTLEGPEDITGFYAVLDTGREGPTVLVLSELDSLVCATHPEAQEGTGYVHACGHHAQCAAMVGIAAALKEEGALDGLCGKIKLCLVPAEEGVEISFRQKLIEDGKISFSSGKPEFISRHYFDDVDVVFMIHTTGSLPEGQYFRLATGANGVIRKKTTFHGRAAHAGGCPHKGINALNAASTALMAVNSLRETFREQDYVRFHSIITKGGDAVNAVPETVVVESYVRGASVEALQGANQKINQMFSGVAAGFGATVEICDLPGSEALKQDPGLNDLASRVLDDLVGREGYAWERTWDTSSTDMGDMSVLFPSIHAYVGGASGLTHGNNYYITDPEQACVQSAVFQVSMLCALLENDAVEAKKIMAGFTPVFASIDEYLTHKKSMAMNKNTVTFHEDGMVTLDFDSRAKEE